MKCSGLRNWACEWVVQCGSDVGKALATMSGRLSDKGQPDFS